jgi:diguanylate cyclase (GGDEF)-like protein
MGGTSAVLANAEGARPSAEGRRLAQVMTVRGGVVSETRIASMSGPMITACVGLACVLLGLSVIWRGDASETAAGFWPPAGGSLVAMLVFPVRRWGWVVAGIGVPTVVGLAFGVMPLSSGLWWAVANTVEPAIAALALLSFVSSRWFSRGRLLLLFLALAVVVAPSVGGAIGAIGTAIGYGDRWSDVWLAWALGDGLGVLVIVPLFMKYTAGAVKRRTAGELAGLVGLVVLATGLAFADIGADGAALLPYLILVVLIWAGMRFGTRAVAAAGFVVGLGANVATSQGFGPFAAANRFADIVTLQIFLAIALITSFVVAAMASELADHDEVRQLLTYQATHDSLTGLPNRVLFGESLKTALQARSESGPGVGVMLIDLDDFKKINDRHGHPIGDVALKAVAERLRHSIRPGDVLATLGGDEFVVMSDDVTGPEHAHKIAQDLSRALAQPFDIGVGQSLVTGSFGIAVAFGDDPVTSSDLLHRADIALYHAKAATGATISLFDESLESHTRRRVEILEELRGAIARGEMSVAYQPVVCLVSGRVTQLEVLARWTSRRFGPVTPDEFIPIAEESGMISSIGDWVLDVACKQLATWRADEVRRGSPATARLAVNVSAHQVCDIGFPARVRSTLDSASLPAAALSLEITETAIMDDLETSALVLRDLRDLGVDLSMDDFGTGYSSMTYLRRMPVSTLKIDRTFVAGLGNEAEDTAIIQSIIELGHSFGLEVVAEGVETLRQLRQLVELGCDHGQGFYWSPAVGASAAGNMLRERLFVPARQIPNGIEVARTVGAIT